MIYSACPWIKPVVNRNERREIVAEILGVLKPLAATFTALAVSGYSSSLISGIIAYELNKDLIVIRKSSESRHSNYEVEGPHNARAIFIDDVICSGHTWKYVRTGLSKLNCELVGIYLYRDYDMVSATAKDQFFQDYGIPILSS